MNKSLKVLSLIAMFLLSVTFTMAQETVGSIEVTTKDSAGALVPGVAVTITSSEGTAGYRRTVTTDGSGFVRVPQIAPGSYRITAAATSGFAETIVSARVELGRASQVTVTLGVQAGAEVTVTGGDAPIDTTSSEISTSVSAQKIDVLPKGNNFTSLLKIVPGVRPEPLAGGFSIDGASNAENTFIIDGQEVTNYRNAGINSNNNVPFGMIQEFQVKSSGFNAEYGGATGGVINVVSKGGNNQFRGDFGVQFEPSKLQGGNRPTLNRFTSGNISTTAYTQTVEYITSPKASYLTTMPSFNLGGPIAKDRLWFFGSYSPQITEQTTDTVFYSNTAAASRTVTNRESYNFKRINEYAFGRLDAAPLKGLRLTGTYLWNPLIEKGALPFGTVSLGGALNCLNFGGSLGQYCGNDLSSRQGGRQSSNNVTFAAAYAPTSNIVANFRYSRGFLNEKLGNYFKIQGTTRYICQNGSTPVVPGVSGANWGPDACTQGNNDAANDYTDRDVSVRTNYEGDISFGFTGGGRHELKGGYAHQSIFNDLSKNDTTRVYLQYGVPINNNFNWSHLATPSGPVCDLDPTTRTPIIVAGCVLGHGSLYRYSERGQGENLNQAFYIQDKWQPHRRLTLNIGVRIEKEALPSFNGYDAPFSFGWGDKIAPRIGGAFDVFGDGKTKIFGSFGDFYDRLKFKMAQGSFGGNFYRVDFFEILPTSGQFRTAFTVPTILGNFPDTIGGACAPTGFIGSGISRCQNDYRVPSNVPGVDIEVAGGIDTDLKPYKQREFTGGIEHELSRNYVIKGRFTNKRLLETVEDAGAISATGSEVYITGNPGRGLHAEFLRAFGYTEPFAHARRDYNAVEVQLDRRFANNYYFNASYTYSRLRGNYSGLSNSDEAGRSDPGVNRSFDLPLIGFTAAGGEDYGALATDRPHVFNVYGGYILPWKGGSNETEFSAFQTFQSGTPQSTLVNFIVPIFLDKRGDMGRTPMFSQTDFRAAHRYKFGRDNRYGVEAYVNIVNLWNQDTVTGLYTTLSNKAMYSFSSAYGYGCASGDYPCLINKFNSGALSSQINANLNTTPTVSLNAKDARYGMDSSFQAPRYVTFGFKFTF